MLPLELAKGGISMILRGESHRQNLRSPRSCREMLKFPLATWQVELPVSISRRTPRSMGRDEHYHHGDLGRALLDAAAKLVQEKGSTGASLREVARRAGVSHTASY